MGGHVDRGDHQQLTSRIFMYDPLVATVVDVACETNWTSVLLPFVGNTFVLAALGYYFNLRLKRLESDLKLKGLIDETVFKNKAATLKEAMKRLLEFKRAVDAYSMLMPRKPHQEANAAMLKEYRAFRDWFAVESIHLPDALKVQTSTVFEHLTDIGFTKGMVILYEEENSTEEAHRERLSLNASRNKTDEILAAYQAKIKTVIGVD